MNEEKAHRKMHELFMQVLKNRDLSRAGDLFSVPDAIIVNDLTNVIKEITAVASLSDYVNNDNDQSVVEICITRVTSCIRETGSIEQHCDALVNLLESCLHHNLQVSNRDEDPPHAKISSDIISCIFLNYSKKSVMQRALPVAVKFLHKGNKELFRNMASYLSLAAMEHASLLTPHVQPIMDSIISGNYPLCRVLPNIYEVSPEPFQGHAMALVSLLPHCDNQEKLALLNLFSLMAKDKPSLLEASVPQLCEYLSSAVTAAATLQIFVHMAEKQPVLLADHVTAIKQVAQRHPQTMCLAAQIIGAIGKLSKDKAQDALNFVLEYLPKADRGSQSTLLREATLLCSSYPVLFTDKVLAGVRQRHHTSSNHLAQNNQVTSGGVTIVKVGGTVAEKPTPQVTSGGYTRRAKLGDSRSTGRLHTAQNSNTHRSMTRLNVAGGSVGGLHKSMTKLSTSREMNTPSNSYALPTSPITVSNASKWSSSSTNATGTNIKVSSGGVTVTTISPPRIQRPLSQGPLSLLNNHIGLSTVPISTPLHVNSNSNSVTVSSGYTGLSSTNQINILTSGAASSTTQNISVIPSSPPPEMLNAAHSIVNCAPTSGSGNVNVSGPTTVISRRNTNNNTSVTLINQNSIANQRMSVFEPYPMRDTIQHFCEKHLDKIKLYMEKVSLRIPSPAKCTIEEKRQKKSAKLHFACQARGQHCLYSKTYFTMRTRNPRIWIHLMFISLQARHSHALSSRDAQVASLKHCWDILKAENKTFLTLVTSAFPCSKDQEALLSELRHAGYFDVFQVCPSSIGGSADPLEGSVSSIGGIKWGCFLCAHPEKAMGFLRGDTQPVIEGQLKEKKGKWRLFRRWRTRYFTLSGAHLSCKGSSGGESIDVHQIRSVRVSRGSRNIPKAFEIFTENQTLILKPSDGKNAEEWVQCLSIVVAHSRESGSQGGKDNSRGKSNSLPARGLGGSRNHILH
ncbi:protein melted [Anthonomus grandis grandis]|uniref:protein melted n=1 Tax=Anthonomus grandis grandis TaxID=2921223 RepID=UPI002166BA76|nr:protein melted [Anthonomus grandis grandis]XP_050304690.1 protein melted [Anthonomus grandis grandis]